MTRGIDKDISKMVEENIRLIYKPVAKFYYSNKPIQLKYDKEELLSVATIALYDAAKKFDKEKGFKFSTYAIPIIQYALIAHTKKDKWYYKRKYKNGIAEYEPLDRISTSSKVKESGSYGDRELTIEETLPDNEDFCENVENKCIVDSLLDTCTEIERDILKSYFYDEKTQVEIAEKFYTSQAVVSRIIKRNLKRFKELLKEEV